MGPEDEIWDQSPILAGILAVARASLLTRIPISKLHREADLERNGGQYVQNVVYITTITGDFLSAPIVLVAYVVSVCGSIDHSSIQVGRVILPVNGVELPSRIELEGAPVLQRPHKPQPMDGRTCDVEFGGQSDTAESCRELYLWLYGEWSNCSPWRLNPQLLAEENLV